MNKGYSVFDVCRYIINYSNRKGYGISNLKLQKLLYFVQAWFLMNKGTPCFNEEIQAWDFGPVVPKAYREYKKYGRMDIPSYEEGEFDDSVVADEDKEQIDKVVEKFAYCTAGDLVVLTHRQTPWISSYARGRNTEITNQSIKDYFDAK